jgi:hypothetical protein
MKKFQDLKKLKRLKKLRSLKKKIIIIIIRFRDQRICFFFTIFFEYSVAFLPCSPPKEAIGNEEKNHRDSNWDNSGDNCQGRHFASSCIQKYVSLIDMLIATDRLG